LATKSARDDLVLRAFTTGTGAGGSRMSTHVLPNATTSTTENTALLLPVKTGPGRWRQVVRGVIRDEVKDHIS